jgi:hypothetical protein
VLSVPLGRRWSATLDLGATALVGRQIGASGSSALAVQPLVSATVGCAYAF